MKFEIVKNSTNLIRIAAEYRTTVKVDDGGHIDVTFGKLTINSNNNQTLCITCNIETYLPHLTISQMDKLKNDIEEFILSNIDTITQEAN